jgi:AcrR family transcriptional regulator
MGTTERRERDKERRRNEILDAAEKVFFSKGITFATMDDIAAAAELSKGTLYLYFDRRQSVYLGITERAIRKMQSMFEQAVASVSGGIKKVRAIGEAYFRFSQEYPDYFSTIANYEVAELDSTLDEPMLSQCHLAGQKAMQIVIDAIQEGIQDGTIRRDLNPVITAFLLNGQMTGLIQMISREAKHLEKFEGLNLDDLLNTFYEFVFNALTPPDPSIKPNGERYEV